MGFGCHREWSGITTLVWICLLLMEGKVNKYDSNSNTFLEYKDPASLDMRATADYLVVTTLNSVYIHNKEMAVVRQIGIITDSKPTFTCATVIRETILLEQKENGMITTSLASASSFENMTHLVLKETMFFSCNFDCSMDSFWRLYCRL
jgi:hypothetical protein